MPRWTNGLLWKTITYILGLYHKWSICWAQQGSKAQLLHNVIPSRAWWTEVMSPSINQLRILHVRMVYYWVYHIIFFFGGDFTAAHFPDFFEHRAGHNGHCVLSVTEGQSWNPTVEVLMTERMPVAMPRVTRVEPRTQRTRFYQMHQPKINDLWLRLRIFGAYTKLPSGKLT